MGLLLKAIKVLIVFFSSSVFGILYTLLMPLAKSRNNILKEKARQVNIDAAKKLNCGAQSVFVRLPSGLNLHAVEAGERSSKLIVLLHGFPDAWHCWSGVIPELVKQGYFVVAPDMRGYNLSDKPKAVNDYRMSVLIADIKNLIEYYYKKDAVVVAHDWGGVVAWALAEAHPEVVEKLIILNAPHNKAYEHVLSKNISQALSSWYIGFFQIPIIPTSLITFNPQKAAAAFLATRKKNVVSKESVELLACAYSQDNAVTSMINYYKAMFRARFFALLNSKKNITGRVERKEVKQVQVPTLVLWGEKDSFLINDLAMCSRWVKDVQVIYIPDCSHWVPYEAPDVVAREVIKFIS